MINFERAKDGMSYTLGAGFILLFLLLFLYAAHIFLTFFAAILFAIFLNGSAEYLAKRTFLTYGLAIAVVLIIIVAVLAFLGMLTGPRLSHQFNQFIDRLPGFLERAKNWLQHTPLGNYLPNPDGSTSGGNGGSEGFSILQGIRGVFSSLSSVIVDGVVILFIGVYAAIGHTRYTKSLLYLVSEGKQDKLQQIGKALVNALRWWMIGRLTMMLIVGVLTAIGLWILQVPLVLFLAFIALILTFVPFIGPIISAIPAVMLALSIDLKTALYVVLLYLFIHTLEGYLITPWIQNRTVNIPPALLIAGQVLMGFLLGIMGIFMATPLLLVIIILIQILYVEDSLGYKVRLMGDHR